MLFRSARTWLKMLVGSAYRVTTLPLAQASGSAMTAGFQALAGDGRAAYLAMRRAGLSSMMYGRYVSNLANASRLAAASFRENEAFMNLGRDFNELSRRGYTESDQLKLKLGAAEEQPVRQNTGDNPFFLDPNAQNLTAVGMRWIWKALNVSGRVAGSIDTFYSALVGPSAEWARLMDQELFNAERRGFEPGSRDAWEWASKRTEELLKEQTVDVIVNGRKIQGGALTGQHARNVMDWASFTDPVTVGMEPRTFEYGVRKAQEEGLTSAREIVDRAQAFVNESPTIPHGFNTASKVVSLVPQLMQNAVEMAPILGLLHPLNRGPANIVKAAMRASGAASPLVDSWWRDIYSQDNFTRERAIGEIAVGYMTLAMGVAMATSGSVQMTGPGSSNAQVRRKQRLMGYKPYSIRFRAPFGGEWSPYYDLTSMDTLSNVFGVIGGYIEKANNLPVEAREALGSSAILTLAEVAKDAGIGQFTKSIFGGITDVMDMINELTDRGFTPEENRINPVFAYFQRRAAGFMPAFVRHMRQGADPVERNIPASDMPFPFSFFHEVAMRYQNQIPGLSESLPATLHPITGEPVAPDQVWGTQYVPADQPWLRALVQGFSPGAPFPNRTASTDPVDQEMAKLAGKGTNFLVWSPNEFNIPQFKLSYEQLNQLTTLAATTPINGKTLHQELLALVTQDEGYANLPYGQPSKGAMSPRAMRINDVIAIYKERAKQAFLESNPDLQVRLGALRQVQTDNRYLSGYGAPSPDQRIRIFTQRQAP